jgi:hypothetical protein
MPLMLLTSATSVTKPQRAAGAGGGRGGEAGRGRGRGRGRGGAGRGRGRGAARLLSATGIGGGAGPAPILPPNHHATGLPAATIADIQTFLLRKVRALARGYDRARDGNVYRPGSDIMRAPQNAQETELLGYFQDQCRELVRAVGRAMPGTPIAARLARNFAKGLVAIDASGNQGVMSSRADGTSVMTVNVSYPIAKTHNIIAHEMAHCALSPRSELSPAEAAGTGGHGAAHTDTWKKFVKIGCQYLGWDFVEFSYPNCCVKYGICDLREFDAAKVYNGAPLKPGVGAVFKGFGPVGPVGGGGGGGGLSASGGSRLSAGPVGPVGPADNSFAWLPKGLDKLPVTGLDSWSAIFGSPVGGPVGGPGDFSWLPKGLNQVPVGNGGSVVPPDVPGTVVPGTVVPGTVVPGGPVATVPVPAPRPTATTKRGLAGGSAALLKRLYPTVTWTYNWMHKRSTPVPAGSEFVPMKARLYWPGYKEIEPAAHVLMYNEPNHGEQALNGWQKTADGKPTRGIATPKQCAAEWPTVWEKLLAARPGVRLGAPCPAGSGNKLDAPYDGPGGELKWLDEYVAALPAGAWARVAFVTMHFYGNSFEGLKKAVDGMWARYKKPIWVTEFAAVGTPDVNLALMKAALPWLDAHPRVERYAWYHHSGDKNSAWLKGGNSLVEADGKTLSKLGRLYLAPAAGIPVVTGGGGLAGIPVVNPLAGIPVGPVDDDDDDDLKDKMPPPGPDVIPTNPDNKLIKPGALSVVPFAARRKTAVFLAPTIISPDELRRLVTRPQEWAATARELAGLWLNLTPKPGTPVEQYKGLWEQLAKYVPNVFAVQNVQAAALGGKVGEVDQKTGQLKKNAAGVVPTMTNDEAKRFRFCGEGYKVVGKCNAQSAGRYEGDGKGRYRPGEPEVSNNAKLVIKRLSQGGAAVNIVGASIVTDYICGHVCLKDEDWQKADVERSRKYWKSVLKWNDDKAGLAAEFDLRDTGVPMFVSARANWFPDKPPYRWDPTLLEVLEAADGVVFEGAPVNFFPPWKLGIYARNLDRFDVCRQWTRANKKTMIWLAPLGEADDYLGTMQKTVNELKRRGIMPDGIVVSKYSPGDNANVRLNVFPERTASGRPDNSLLGITRWLLDNA